LGLIRVAQLRGRTEEIATGIGEIVTGNSVRPGAASPVISPVPPDPPEGEGDPSAILKFKSSLQNFFNNTSPK